VAAPPPEVRLAAIDVGSNSIHMIIAQVDAGGGVTTLWRMKEMVGLGRISFPGKRLSADAMDRAIATLARFQQAALQRGCEQVVAVATSAVREAENGGDFIERIRNELGLRIKVVSGRDEARLIYLGVRHATDLNGGPHLLLDIGGGSVEFIVATEAKPLLLESRKLGSARMTAKFVKSDPIEAKDLTNLLRHYRQELTPLCESIKALKPARVLGSSGTLENLAAMTGGLSGEKSSGNGASAPGIAGVIERDALESLTARLLESRAKDRAGMPGLDAKRQDQILAGAVLVRELFDMLELKRMYVCRGALREGILVDYLSRHQPELQIRREVPDPRRRSVLDLGRRCAWHQQHAEHVAKLTGQLFDALKPLHGLGKRERELIEYGAMLHDVGWHISPDAHHKHSMYLVQHGNLKGFEPEEVQIIANVARYHRKSPPKPEHEHYTGLSARARRTVQVGAAILRIADSLDRTHCGAVSAVQAKVGKHRIKLMLTPRGDTEMELWAARRKMAMFADVFDRTVSFELARK
jgi:exopolyphosphatase/guanosine-5'-triphosphate,3'-diphosphate pyrophosphatase